MISTRMDENPFQDRELVKVDLDRIGELVKLQNWQKDRLGTVELKWNSYRIGSIPRIGTFNWKNDLFIELVHSKNRQK